MVIIEQDISRFATSQPLTTMLSHELHGVMIDDEIEHGGILQTLERLVDARVNLDDGIVAGTLSIFDAIQFAFWSKDRAFVDIAKSLASGSKSYDEVIRDGFWNRAWTWLSDFNLDSEHRSVDGQRLTIAEIHTPHVPGCEGTFAASKASELDVSVKAFGLGYQKIKRIKITNAYKKSHGCAALTTGVQFVVHVWKHKSQNKRRALIRFISIDGFLTGAALPSTPRHYCRKAYQSSAPGWHSMAPVIGYKVGKDYTDVPMREEDPADVTTRTLEIDQGVLYSGSLELPISWFSPKGTPASLLPKVSISIESRVVRTVEMAWNLVGGHNYLGFRGGREDRRMFWLWD